MKHLMFLFVILFHVSGYANLLSSVQIEESYRQKLQNYVELFDDQARVVLKFEYKKIEGTLPGTNLSAEDEAPSVIDTNDIVKAKIFVISGKEKFSEKFEVTLKGLLPIPSSRVSVVIEKKTSDMVKQEQETIKVQDLKNISSETVEKLLNHFTILFLSVFGLSALMLAYFSSRKTKEFRTQMVQIQEALLSQSATPVSSASLAEPMNSRIFNSNVPQLGSEDLVARQLANFTLPQTLVILSDCYWCRLDGEAAWLWRRLDISSKRELISMWKPLEEYSKFLLTQNEIPTSLYQDPFYYSAQDIKDIDNSDLFKVLEQEPQAWNFVSSTRQKNIPISLELSLKLTTMKEVDYNYEFTNLEKSAYRVFESLNVVNDLSLEDELRILNNPEFIPDYMRKNVPSLCWLAGKDADYINAALAQFDAKALATAWIGPEEVLKKFEGCLSEKKLKALQSYLQVARPSRKSESFMKLHQLGIVNDAA